MARLNNKTGTADNQVTNVEKKSEGNLHNVITEDRKRTKCK